MKKYKTQKSFLCVDFAFLCDNCMLQIYCWRTKNDRDDILCHNPMLYNSFCEDIKHMILSVSRRTDIPAYYSEWFMNRLQEEHVLINNPMNANQISKVALNPYVET